MAQLIPNLSIDILSGKLNSKGRKWKLLLIFSIATIFLIPYPLNKILGETTLSKVIVGSIFAFFGISAAVFKYISKYETIGKLVLNANGIIIKNPATKKIIYIENVSEISLKYKGYWDQPYFGGRSMRTKEGNGNYISIKNKDEDLSCEVFITSSRMKNALLSYLQFYKEKNIRVEIRQIQ